MSVEMRNVIGVLRVWSVQERLGEHAQKQLSEQMEEFQAA